VSGINFSGLASGLDTSAIIDALVNAQRIPIQRLQSKQVDLDVRISKMGELKSKLTAFQEAAEKLETVGDILAYNATSDNEDVLKVSTSSGTLPGSFEVTVNQLAKAEKNRSGAFANQNAAVKAGTLSIAVNGGTAKDVEITEGMTLRDVADAINSAEAGVQASIISDGTSSYLQVTSLSTGFTTASANDAVTITESYTGAAGGELGLTQISAAQNAELTVDGLLVTSRSNTVTGAVEGVTLELKDAGTATVAVDSDRDKIKENLQGFVDAYNGLADFIGKELKLQEGVDRDRTLSGEPVLRQLKAKLSSFVSGFISGTAGDFDALSQVGIRTNSSGQLSINNSELDRALDQDPLGVAEVFLKDGNGLVAQVTATAELYGDATDGLLTLREKALGTENRRLEDLQLNLEERLGRVRESLQARFTAMERSIAAINAQGSQLSSFLSSQGGSQAQG
jgi:flagellar hook-associated protein 2